MEIFPFIVLILISSGDEMIMFSPFLCLSQVEEVERIFGRMLEARVYPDAPLYNALILGYARIGDAKRAFKRFNDVG